MSAQLSLRAQIRRIDDAADRRLAQPEILAKLARTNRNVFCVTVAQMLEGKQLSRRKITRAVRALNPRAQFVYGPGREPVEETMHARRPRKMVGFMEMARQRAGRARS